MANYSPRITLWFVVILHVPRCTTRRSVGTSRRVRLLAASARSREDGISRNSQLVLWILCAALLAEAHFFWTHRMLHAVPFLYRHVHKVHRAFVDPNPFVRACLPSVWSAIYLRARARARAYCCQCLYRCTMRDESAFLRKAG